jgi:hypothetical protein
VDEISSAVKGIHSGLAWELGPSHRARNTFCVTSEGNLAIRRYAEDWLAAAPEADGTWEFVTARPPVPSSSLGDIAIELGGASAKVGEARVAITPDKGRERLDLSVWHPAFPDLPVDARAQLGYLILDTALGEDGVERWVGRIEWVGTPTDHAVGIATLPAEIERFATDVTGDQFALFQGPSQRTGNDLILNLNTALKHIDHIGKEHLLTVSIPGLTTAENGMPSGEETARLEPIEDQLDVALREVAVMGRLTGDGSRILYRYVASGAAADIARTWAAGFLGDRRVSIDVREDSGWDWYRDGIYRVFKPRS